MSWVGVAVAGSAIIGGVASNSAAKKQASAANQATDVQKQMFDITNQNQAPYREAGYGALNKLQTYLGTLQAPKAPTREDFTTINGKTTSATDFADPVGQKLGVNFASQALGFGKKSQNNDPVFNQAGFNAATTKYQNDLAQYQQDIQSPEYGSFTHQFNANDLNSNLAPNWQFALEQGQGANRNMANASGGMLSGNTLKGIADYTLNKSGDLYQQAFQNYTANQTNIFNRLSNIAGLGQTANQATGSAATAAAGQMGQSIQNAGAAQAAGIVGGANAVTGGINNAGSWYAINNMVNPKTKPSAVSPFYSGTGEFGGADIGGVGNAPY